MEKSARKIRKILMKLGLDFNTPPYLNYSNYKLPDESFDNVRSRKPSTSATVTAERASLWLGSLDKSRATCRPVDEKPPSMP